MIKRKDVITLKVPFPSINSRLAKVTHMYICLKITNKSQNFVKCQSLKPYMLEKQNPMKHFIDEEPDIHRNPFVRTTRIDCDKEFYTFDVNYDERLKTGRRNVVCDDLIKCIENELLSDGYKSHHINEEQLVNLNTHTSFLSKVPN